ncbi:Ig-like domain-containing protein [Sulfurovum mangrovi]|uniref:Ig-like domain-containing protein n=1 Tax=Sulfurovum mangrovi TaxID=2893889 RepID=UPI001E5DEE07|nr:Ig-like domain-containing protein [Sulfurovum mangrovi]UFH59077.1 Ig-like domain-containing protein [Sulfurovum mangrovi]
MQKLVQLIVKDSGDQVYVVKTGTGKPLIIKAQSGAEYEIREVATNVAPQQILLKRKGKDLLIKIDSENEKDGKELTEDIDIVIEDYYDGATGKLIGLSEDGLYYDIVPQEADSDFFASNLDDGDISYQSLGYYGEDSENEWYPYVLGALALGGLALAFRGDDKKPHAPDAPDAPDMTDQTDTGISDTDDNTADNTPDFEITPPADGETPNLYIDGELVPSTFDPVNNIITPTDPIPDGPHTVTVTLTDSHGESPQSPGLDIIIDTVPPALTAEVDPASDSGVVGDGITNDTTPTISGTGEEGAAISVVINGETLTTTVDPDGNWSVTPTVPMSDGTYTAVVSETDIAGNTTISDVPVTIDTTIEVSITGIEDDTGVSNSDFITNDTNIFIHGTVDLDDGNTLSVTFDGTTYTEGTDPELSVDGSGNWTLDVTGTTLADDTYPIVATVTDIAGNTASATEDVVIDTTADNDGDLNTVSITGIEDDTGVSNSDFITNDTNIFIHGTVDLDDGNTLSVTFDGTTYTEGTDPELSVDGSGNWTLDVTGTTLADDTYPIVATVTDIAGNTASATEDVVIDTAVNSVTIVSIDEDTDTAGDFITTDGNGLAVHATLSSNLAADERLWYSNDNGVTWSDISSSVSGTDITYQDDDLTSTTTVIMRVEDTAGNSAEDSQVITINTLPGVPTTTVDIVSIDFDSGINGDFITNDNDGLTIGATLSDPLVAGESLWYRTDSGTWIDITGDIGVDGVTVSHVDSSLTTTDVVQMKVVNGTGDGPVASQLVTIDTTAPLAPTVVLTEDVNNDGYINSSELSGDVDVRITLPSGTVEGDTVNVTDGTASQTFVLTGTDITNGYIDTSFASPGEGNTITVTATVTDIAGNEGPEGSDSAQIETVVPVVVNATANVSEEGLPGAASDMIGTPEDTTNAATVTGVISMSDTSGITSVAVSGPAGLTSGGVSVTWNGSFVGDTYTLTGMAGTTAVATLTLDTAGAYTFTLLEPLDHPVADAEDILALGFSVTATDIYGNTSTPGTLTINVEDDSPLAADSATFVMETQPDTAEGSLVVSYGADGGYVSEISFDGNTYTYDPVSDAVTPSGSSALVESWSFNAENDELTINTTQGETFVVDMHSGEYSYAALGTDEQVGPEVNVNPSASLLGIANAEALGLIDIGTNQMFTATDANNDIEEVVVRADSLLSLGLLNYYNLVWSEEMAAEFGLNVVETNDILNLFLVTTQSYSQLTITSLDGGPIDNLQLNEFLATVYVDQTGLDLLSLGLLPELSITATDSLGNSDTDTEQDVLGLSLLAPSGSSANIIEGTSGTNSLNGSTEDDRIYGYGGNDTLNGGEGNDLLRGGAGDDILIGADGNDILIGGKGNDTLSGGSGNDTFIWEEGDAGSAGSPAEDIITDFNKEPVNGGGDIIKLGGLLQGELARGNTVGNLTDYLHFELSGGDTVLYISTTGGFSGGFISGAVDQQITLTGVDLIGDFTTDEEVIAQLLANGNLIVDQETTATDQLNGLTTFDAVITDNDGDTASTSVTFDTRDPAAPIPGNVAPVVQDDATALLGLVGLNLLDIIGLSSQAFAAADANGNLRSVVVEYVGLIDVSLEDPVFIASEKLAEELGLSFEVVSTTGLLGLVAPTSTITITALDGGDIDNQAVNELLATVRLESSTNLLGLVPTLDVTVLGSFDITATDSEGLTATESVATLANANVLEGLLGNEGNPDIIEGTSGDDTLNSSTSGGSDERLYGHEGDDTINGGDGNDLIRGGAGDDTLNGGDGNDILIDGNGADTFSGGEGDDWIVISDTESFVSIDGGTGVDTLYLSGSSMTLDLSGISGTTLTSIEKIDLSGTGNNALIVEYSDLLDLSESSEILYVTGDSGDTVTLSEETWRGTDTVDGIIYETYDIGGTGDADIWVQQGVTVL